MTHEVSIAHESYSSPRGKRRREVLAPAELPSVDLRALADFQRWRQRTYKQPILDDLTGYYQFPPTKKGVLDYTRPDPLKLPVGLVAVGKEEVRALLAQKRQAEAKRERQPLHIAQTAERATALFWRVAEARESVLAESIRCISSGEDMPSEVLGYAADAIIDFGLCLEAPYARDATGKTNKQRTGLAQRIERFGVGLGTDIAEFGAYAERFPEVLRTGTGVMLLQVTLEEQAYRSAGWRARHEALVSVYPELPLTDAVIHESLTLPELFAIEQGTGQAE